MGNVIKNKTINNWLHATGTTDDIYSTKIFSGFSGVHKEAKLIDVDLARKQLYKSVREVDK